MRVLACAFACLALAFGACDVARVPAEPGEPVIELTIVRHAPGSWSAHYRFPQEAQAWVFPRSALTRAEGVAWRPVSWTIETPGVSLRRIGERDVLMAETGPVPAEVSIAFDPYTSLLLADYVPVLAFSDEAEAVFTGHFIAGPADMAALAAGSDPFDDAPGLAVTFLDEGGGPIVIGGAVEEGRASYRGREDTYAYFGTGEPVSTEHLVLLVDAQVPGWIDAELGAFMPELVALYAERLGVRLEDRPTVYAVWEGADNPGLSMGGSVVPGLLAANFSGQGLLEPNARFLQYLRAFYAHEAAHFFNGWTITPAGRENAFVHEGGAEALSFLAMDTLVADYDLAAAKAGSIERCRDGGGQAALRDAQMQGREDAVYGCGALAHFAAANALSASGHDIFDLWAAVIDDSMAGEPRTFTMEDWLGVLEGLSGDAALADTLRRWSVDGLSEAEFEALAERALASQ